MSEIPQIGRNPIYLATLAVFVAFQAPTALASNFGMLLAFRFLTGFFGSPVLATGGAYVGLLERSPTRADLFLGRSQTSGGRRSERTPCPSGVLQLSQGPRWVQ